MVQFKLLLQVYKTLNGLAPSYLSNKLSLRPNKGLRSDNQLLLDVPKSTLQLKYYGIMSFFCRWTYIAECPSQGNSAV